MNSHDTLLLLAGSFLPNNLLIWLFSKLRTALRREKKRHIHLISPRKYYTKFESDPVTQYHYHSKMQKFWIYNLLPVTILLILDILACYNKLPSKLALLIPVVMLSLNTFYSLYANWDTETGDAHAAYASIKADEIQANQTEDVSHDQVDNIVQQIEAWSLPTTD